jgi:hypothetical protein
MGNQEKTRVLTQKEEIHIKTSDSLALALADEKLERVGCDNRFNIYPEYLIYSGTPEEIENFINTRNELKETEKGPELKEGDIFYTSWGYDQTQYNFIKVIEISKTGKTCLCRMVHLKSREPAGKTLEKEEPGTEPFGDKFRMKIYKGEKEIILRGSYPFIDGHVKTSTRLDSFSKHKLNKKYYATALGCGH